MPQDGGGPEQCELCLFRPRNTHADPPPHVAPLLLLCKSDQAKVNIRDNLEGQKIMDKRASLKGGKKSPTSFPLLKVAEGNVYSMCTGLS